MARTNTVKSARKSQGGCCVCRKPINIGDPYKWVKPRYRGKIVACPNCTIPLSMTSSSKMVAIYEDVDGLDRTSVESVAEDLHALAETVRGVGEEYQESADNQREYFPDSEVADENEEKAQELDGWADNLETEADEAESELQELEELRQELDDPETTDSRKEELESEIEDKEADILGHLDEVDNCPV